VLPARYSTFRADLSWSYHLGALTVAKLGRSEARAGLSGELPGAAFDVRAAALAQRPVRVRLLGNGVTVLNEVELHALWPPAPA
jgi:hypothetical protein